MLEPFGEIGANFSLQLSSRTRFDKINKKKVIAENQCEKHIKSSLVLLSCNSSFALKCPTTYRLWIGDKIHGAIIFINIVEFMQ